MRAWVSVAHGTHCLHTSAEELAVVLLKLLCIARRENNCWWNLVDFVLGSGMLQVFPLWLWTGSYLASSWNQQYKNSNTDPTSRIMMPQSSVECLMKAIEAHILENLSVHSRSHILFCLYFLSCIEVLEWRWNTFLCSFRTWSDRCLLC